MVTLMGTLRADYARYTQRAVMTWRRSSATSARSLGARAAFPPLRRPLPSPVVDARYRVSGFYNTCVRTTRATRSATTTTWRRSSATSARSPGAPGVPSRRAEWGSWGFKGIAASSVPAAVG